MIAGETLSTYPTNDKKTVIRPDTFAFDILSGLLKSPKSISSKYFYDDQGSQLFEQIMQLPEYYPTRCEAQIFEAHKETLFRLCQREYYHIVDLGAGDAAKTRIWIDHFYKNGLDFEYIPVDISQYSVDTLIENLDKQYPLLKTRSVAADYISGLNWIRQHVHGRKLVLFLGSNIGNFTAEECRLFLLQIWHLLDEDDHLLIGFDLKKNATVIRNAYNDSSGVTEAFNKNLLRRINTELGANFDVDAFDFFAGYDPQSGFIKSYLISKKRQEVFIKKLHRSFEFKAWEAIHTENSRKFSIEEIEDVAVTCGYQVETHLFDDKHYFADSIWKVTGKRK